jgi:hypothetical protein
VNGTFREYKYFYPERICILITGKKEVTNMFTTFDKALVALIMSLLSLLNLVFGVDLGVSPEVVTAIVTAITPILVYLVPNKPKTV